MTGPLAGDRVGAPFRFDYDPGVLRYGADSVADLAAELDRQGFERALVVCGSTVGSTPAVMDPVRSGLGDRLAGVFDGTTPEKRLSTALDARDAYRGHDADVLVSLGGGSSLDVAKAVSMLAAGGHDREAAAREFAQTGTLSADGDLEPIVAVPTTLAGADLSVVAGLNAHPDSGLVDDAVGGGLSDRRLMPHAVFYDPALVATTPGDVLVGSAMNGFDKGIETLYAANATPITDATAARGLGLLADGLRELGRGDVRKTPESASATHRNAARSEDVDADALEPVLEGLLLVQYGISRPGETTLSVIHAFGHGLTDGYAVQQGAAHAVVAPHVLHHLFAEVDGRRDLLADALGVGDADDPAEAVVDAVAGVRDSLGLPDSLADVAGPEPGDFPAVAETVVADSFLANAPPGLDLTTDDVEAVLRAAY